MSETAAAAVPETTERFASLLDATGDTMAQDGPQYESEERRAPVEAAPEEDTAPEEASGEEDAEEVEAEAETEAESDESETTDSDQEEAEEVEPEEVIDPPPSWSAADKETFSELPVAAQRAIAHRERQREQFVNEKAREIADERKAVKAEREAITTERQTKIGHLDTALNLLGAELQGEFAGVNWQELAAVDPAEYVAKKARYDAKVQSFNQAQQARDEQQALANQETQGQRAQYVQGEQQRLLEAIPEWADAKKAKAGKAELLDAAKHYGFTDDELGSLYDHRTVLVLRDAAKWCQLQKSKAKVEKKVENKPKVQKPGNKNLTSRDAKSKTVAAKRKQLRKDGRPESAASVFEEFIDD
jgi:hypothetical protein